MPINPGIWIAWAQEFETNLGNIVRDPYLYKNFKKSGLGMVAYACIASILGGWDEQITWIQEFKTSLGNTAKPHLYQINK